MNLLIACLLIHAPYQEPVLGKLVPFVAFEDGAAPLGQKKEPGKSGPGGDASSVPASTKALPPAESSSPQDLNSIKARISEKLYISIGPNKWDPKNEDSLEFDPNFFSGQFQEFARGPQFYLELMPKRIGKTTITIHRKKINRSFNYEIIPNEEYLADFLKSQFPLADLRVRMPKDDIVFVDGIVEGPEDENKIRELVKKFGIIDPQVNIRVAGPTQIQLHVVIARVDRSELRRLGFDFLLDVNKNIVGTQTSGAGGLAPFGPANPTYPQNSNAFFGINGSTVKLYSLIDTLRKNNVAKILANPTLVTYNGRQADFLVGGQVPIPVTGSITAPSVNYKEYGTRLSFLPVLVNDGKIRIEVAPEVSSIDETNTSVISGIRTFNFKTQRLHSTVEMKPGESLFMGGLIQTEMEAETNKLYFLGDVPGVGTFFRNTRVKSTERELLILVTPRLVQPLDCDPAGAVFPGQSTMAPSDAELTIRGATESALRPGKTPKKERISRLGEDLGSPVPILPPPISPIGPDLNQEKPQKVLPPPRSINPVSWLFKKKPDPDQP